MDKKVLVGLSGGIDSSVTAYLLKEEGYDVEGVTMLIWKKDSPYPAPVSPNSCYNPDKTKDLIKIDNICGRIGIKHTVVDCSGLYEKKVLDNFKNEYMMARTPNPCIWCNSLIKFGAMLDEARKVVDFDYFATGHYANIEYGNGRYCLKKAADLKKDQSYFLSRLTQEQLSCTLFPLGKYTKSEIRKIDVEQGFHPEAEPESQDFYGGDYTDLLQVKDEPGEILFTDGRVVGRHEGFWHYTIGQRKGLGIAWSEPLYVVDLDPVFNRVIVGLKGDTFSSKAECSMVNWVSETDFTDDQEHQPRNTCTCEEDGEGLRGRILPACNGCDAGAERRRLQGRLRHRIGSDRHRKLTECPLLVQLRAYCLHKGTIVL